MALNNDANCFALSEAWDKSIVDAPTVLGLILGTGFGGGLVVRGELVSGLNNVAGELGHMRLPVDAWLAFGENTPLFDCGCGQKACIDNYLSGRGFEALYQARFGSSLKAIEIIAAFYANDEATQAFVADYVDLLARVLAGIFTAIDPDVVVLGGGLSNFEYLYQALPEVLPKYLLSVASAPEIRKAQYGDSGGVRGAAFLNLKK